MCGIAGIISRKNQAIPDLEHKLSVMSTLLAHRGPDGAGYWTNGHHSVGFAHRRLSIIDLSTAADQPMRGESGNVIVLNGEIYNYQALRQSLQSFWQFKTNSDTETLLASYQRYGQDCLTTLRGMFAFGLWDEQHQLFFAARDRFGIKPFYYLLQDDCFFFASEVKALLPFVPHPEIDRQGLAEYITLQMPLVSNTLFKDIRQLPAAHNLSIKDGRLSIERYWSSNLSPSNHSSDEIHDRLHDLLENSVKQHLISDAPVGCYLSGGLDSSIISALAAQEIKNMPLFHGKFSLSADYDESPYAQMVANRCESRLYSCDITAKDFTDNISKIIYFLDYPVAGPGAFPQYLVAKEARAHVKVLLAGQGGDELFGGYARYLIAYLDLQIKEAINGRYSPDNAAIKLETLVAQLAGLKSYKSLLQQFWGAGLFEDFDQRYYRLINRANDIDDEINWHELGELNVFHEFQVLFNSENVNTSPFEQMLRFDFNYLLPGLLHVEDRMSMANGIESRVPFLDHTLVEFVQSLAANIKFKEPQKYLLRSTFAKHLPLEVVNRQDKMGFPVPLNEWSTTCLRDFIMDTFTTGKNKNRPYINYDAVLQNFDKSGKFSRKLWAFLSLELWQQHYFDQPIKYSAATFQAPMDVAVL